VSAPVLAPNLELSCSAPGIVADLEAYGGWIGTGYVHSVHVCHIGELRGSAVHGLKVEVYAQAVDRAVKYEMHASANLTEAARGFQLGLRFRAPLETDSRNRAPQTFAREDQQQTFIGVVKPSFGRRPVLNRFRRSLKVQRDYLNLPADRNRNRHVASGFVTRLIFQFSL